MFDVFASKIDEFIRLITDSTSIMISKSYQHQKLFTWLKLPSDWTVLKINIHIKVESVTFQPCFLSSVHFTSLLSCLKVNATSLLFSAGPSASCCGRCWQERCPIRMWTPPLSSGEWATTVCSCQYPKAVQTASNCSWGNAGERAGGEDAESEREREMEEGRRMMWKKKVEASGLRGYNDVRSFNTVEERVKEEREETYRYFITRELQMQ